MVRGKKKIRYDIYGLLYLLLNDTNASAFIQDFDLNFHYKIFCLGNGESCRKTIRNYDIEWH